MTEQNTPVDENNESISKSDLDKLHPRELDSLQKLRKKIRIIDPASVYEFRHVKITIWSSIAQLVTMLVSLALLLLLTYYTMGEFSSIKMEGVGEVSELTIIDKLSIYMPFFIIFISCLSLTKKLKERHIPGYWLAMFSNALNRATLNNVKLMCYPLLLIFGSELTLEYYNIETDSPLLNGVAYDIATAIFISISMIIYYLAFRFCFKRL